MPILHTGVALEVGEGGVGLEVEEDDDGSGVAVGARHMQRRLAPLVLWAEGAIPTGRGGGEWGTIRSDPEATENLRAAGMAYPFT